MTTDRLIPQLQFTIISIIHSASAVIVNAGHIGGHIGGHWLSATYFLFDLLAEYNNLNPLLIVHHICSLSVLGMGIFWPDACGSQTISEVIVLAEIGSLLVNILDLPGIPGWIHKIIADKIFPIVFFLTRGVWGTRVIWNFTFDPTFYDYIVVNTTILTIYIGMQFGSIYWLWNRIKHIS